MWTTYPRSASSVYHVELYKGCYQKQTSSSDNSCYHADFQEGHGSVGEWQGHGRGTAWERHGMCELAFTEALPVLVTKLPKVCDVRSKDEYRA
jgi:hypothetical protein